MNFNKTITNCNYIWPGCVSELDMMPPSPLDWKIVLLFIFLAGEANTNLSICWEVSNPSNPFQWFIQIPKPPDSSPQSSTKKQIEPPTQERVKIYFCSSIVKFTSESDFSREIQVKNFYDGAAFFVSLYSFQKIFWFIMRYEFSMLFCIKISKGEPDILRYLWYYMTIEQNQENIVRIYQFLKESLRCSTKILVFWSSHRSFIANKLMFKNHETILIFSKKMKFSSALWGWTPSAPLDAQYWIF